MDLMLQNEENLASTMRLIRRAIKAQRFALIFANCNSLTEQNHYIQELQQACSEIQIFLVTIDLWNREPVKNLRSAIQEELEKKFPEDRPSYIAIQVVGLELSILLDPDEKFPIVLQILNVGREGYRKELPYPLVLWLPDYAIVKLANVAPDFWSVRDGSFNFCSQEASEQDYSLNHII